MKSFTENAIILIYRRCLMKKIIALTLFACFIIISCCIFSSASPAPSGDLAIVFTHDMHSHVEPFSLGGKTVGGFSRIKTVIDKAKNDHPNTIVLDGGDFSMGTLYQTIYGTKASEYRLLGEMGYDAVTFGNHEFDYGLSGVKDMLSAAKSNASELPPVLCANIDFEASGITENELVNLNVNKYSVFKKGNYTVAVFGLLGRNANDCAPSSGLVFTDFVAAAKSVVAEIKSVYSPDVIICLSHSGTGDSVNDEDIELAKSVPDINVIVSAHTHSVLEEPITIGNTVIASTGEYGHYVGELVLNVSGSETDLISYNLTEIDSSIEPDKAIEESIELFKNDIAEYLSVFGYDSPDQVVAYCPFDFTVQNDFSNSLSEQPLGNLISDSYRYAVEAAEDDDYVPVDVAVVPNGVIRSSIEKGNISVSKVFEISSLGIGADGVPGYPLCSVYLSGKELWTLAEVDASVSAIMPEAQLYCSGLCYSVNTNRMFLNRVYDCWLTDENGNRVEIDDDKLYRVVSGMYSAKMLGTVNGKSYGLLNLTPKNADGSVVDNYDNNIIHDSHGVEIKEWKSLADYLSSFPKGANSTPTVPARYSANENRKNVSDEFVFGQIFTNWNFIAYAVLIIALILILLIVLLIFIIVRQTKKRRKKKSLLKFADDGTEII